MDCFVTRLFRGSIVFHWLAALPCNEMRELRKSFGARNSYFVEFCILSSFKRINRVSRFTWSLASSHICIASTFCLTLQ